MLIVSFRRSLFSPAPEVARRSEPARSTVGQRISIIIKQCRQKEDMRVQCVGPHDTSHGEKREASGSEDGVAKRPRRKLTQVQHRLAPLIRQWVYTLNFEAEDRM